MWFEFLTSIVLGIMMEKNVNDAYSDWIWKKKKCNKFIWKKIIY